MQGAPTVLYWDRSMCGIPKWELALIGWGAVFLAILLVSWKPWRYLYREANATRPGVEKPEGFLQSLAISWWAIVMILSTSIWVTTVFNQKNRVWSNCVWPLLGGFCIVFFTFALEGLETAYIELRDKDEQQFVKDNAAFHVYTSIKKGLGSQLGDSAFFEAREWAIITLLVAATLMIDKSEYYIPLVAHVSAKYSSQEPLVKAVRLMLTIALTTFALVWVAQSPGKFVARKNSVNFLSYPSSQVALPLLQWAWRALSFVGLQHPSKVTDELALKIFRRCRERRNLPPSEFSFFADSLKKYGYGFLITDTSLEIRSDGSCKIKSKTLFYVGMARDRVRRTFSSETGFPEGTVDRLREATSGDLKCWAFDGPAIGEKVTAEDLDGWARLFNDPGGWKPEGYVNIPTTSFSIDARLSSYPANADHSTDQLGELSSAKTLEMDLAFNQSLPLNEYKTTLASADYRGQRALLLFWELTLETLGGAVPLPTSFGQETAYPYFRMHPNPGLRDTVVITLPIINGAKFVVAKPDDQENYEVRYEGVKHKLETQRFQKQERDPLFGHAAIKRSSELTNSVEIYVDNKLPGALYLYNLHILKQRTAEPEAPNSQGR